MNKISTYISKIGHQPKWVLSICDLQKKLGPASLPDFAARINVAKKKLAYIVSKIDIACYLTLMIIDRGNGILISKIKR